MKCSDATSCVQKKNKLYICIGTVIDRKLRENTYKMQFICFDVIIFQFILFYFTRLYGPDKLLLLYDRTFYLYDVLFKKVDLDLA